MDIEFRSHLYLHLRGKNATHPIARFSGRLAALLFVAGSGHAPHRALPDNPKTAHSDASNRSFQDNRGSHLQTRGGTPHFCPHVPCFFA